MPARMAPLSPDQGPLPAFACELRQLRNGAPAGRELSVQKVATGSASRAAIYAAMRGKVLPSRETLAVMVEAWAPGRGRDLPKWIARRAEVEALLVGQDLRPTYTANRSTESANGHSAQPTTFGQELRRLRHAANLSLSELADRIHYSKGYLSKVESGVARPNKALADLADQVFGSGQTLSDLAKGRGSSS